MAALSPQLQQGPRMAGLRWWPMSEGTIARSWEKLVVYEECSEAALGPSYEITVSCTDRNLQPRPMN